MCSRQQAIIALHLHSTKKLVLERIDCEGLQDARLLKEVGHLTKKGITVCP
jgi:hypothetical protein